MLTILKIITYIIGHIPLKAALLAGRLAGRLIYLIDARHRKTVMDNLKTAYKGQMSEARMTGITKGVFASIGMTAFEFMRIPWLDKAGMDRLVVCRGRERLDAALARGKGVIIYTAHFGNWELMAAWFGLNGYGADIVVRELDSPLMENFVAWVRTRPGNRMVHKGRNMRKLLKHLSANGMAGILLDQNVADVEGVFVDYFGVPACTNKGPAMLAAMSGAAMLPCFMVRKGTRHTIYIGEETPLVRTGDKEADTTANTAACTKAIEDMVRVHPEQWFWVHRRWKTRPKGEKRQ
ncbi:MAG: lysophospholipid acyltransferase family protein [Deltaproteobacteria bacterium]|nr:lysophospholipid acyltransferase family protein [Deltaproteobacteria bacterium]